MLRKGGTAAVCHLAMGVSLMKTQIRFSCLSRAMVFIPSCEHDAHEQPLVLFSRPPPVLPLPGASSCHAL